MKKKLSVLYLIAVLIFGIISATYGVPAKKSCEDKHAECKMKAVQDGKTWLEIGLLLQMCELSYDICILQVDP
ncbi:MAG: hypothetical protein SCM96_10795 [Acidobacteriota bacterium]|nr:hypothetical protein [Acidobacteriota bacterium]